MKRIEDSKLLLKASSDLLSDIKKLYLNCIYDDSLSNKLKLQIKYFLENIRSCLDYTTNYIFDKYCRNNYKPNELKNIERSIYFPIMFDKISFEKRIKNRFKGLMLTDDIVLIFIKYQPYNNNQWIVNLHKLTNKNKHVELIKNNRTESGTINYLRLPNGAIIENCSFENCGHILASNDGPISLKTLNTNSKMLSYEGDLKASYFFSETNTPIIETLEEILIGTNNVLNDLWNVL